MPSPDVILVRLGSARYLIYGGEQNLRFADLGRGWGGSPRVVQQYRIDLVLSRKKPERARKINSEGFWFF